MLPAKTEHPWSSAASLQPQETQLIKVTLLSDPTNKKNIISFQLLVTPGHWSQVVWETGTQTAAAAFPEGRKISTVIFNQL